MRSDLVFTAGFQVSNRFLLATIAMRVARKLHVNSSRIEQTVNNVFSEIAQAHFTDGKLPEVIELPAIEVPLIVYAA